MSFPAASASASRWRAASPCGRTSCCSTSRSPISTCICASRCLRSSRASTRRSARPSSTSPTTRPKRWRWPIRVAVMDAGRVEQMASPRTLYAEPASEMVARFVGRGIVVPALVIGRNSERVVVDIWGLRLPVRGAGAVRRAALAVPARGEPGDHGERLRHPRPRHRRGVSRRDDDPHRAARRRRCAGAEGRACRRAAGGGQCGDGGGARRVDYSAGG